MSTYRRFQVEGGTYFFTVVTARRRPWLGHPETLNLLGRVLRSVRASQPFTTDAMVVLPDHLHCIWTLPPSDTDYSRRWRCIKQRMTLQMRGARGHTTALWQPRFWEHLIRDDIDFQRHVDYIHYNPVKHGLTERPADWRASTFQHYVARGWYAVDWAGPQELADIAE
jgi:putative transposase